VDIYISSNGAQAGPFSLDEVWKMVAEGKYSPSDYGWHDKLTEWVPLSTLVPAVGEKIQSALAVEDVPNNACTKCGVAFDLGASFCTNCGAALKAPTAEHIHAGSKTPAHVRAPQTQTVPTQITSYKDVPWMRKAGIYPSRTHSLN